MERRSRTGGTIVAILAWAGLGLQCYLTVGGRANAWQGLVFFLSFFTVLTNLIVAFVTTARALRPNAGRRLASSNVAAATLSYIVIVGVVYSLVLRELWQPRGWQAVADRLLHDLVPVAYLLYWIVCVEKRTLRWRAIPGWLTYPILYLAYSLVRGAFGAGYPYPFIDVDALGYGTVAMNAAGLVLAFYALSAGIVAVDRRWPEPQH
jgi:hypothetical protein